MTNIEASCALKYKHCLNFSGLQFSQKLCKRYLRVHISKYLIPVRFFKDCHYVKKQNTGFRRCYPYKGKYGSEKTRSVLTRNFNNISLVFSCNPKSNF